LSKLLSIDFESHNQNEAFKRLDSHGHDNNPTQNKKETTKAQAPHGVAESGARRT